MADKLLTCDELLIILAKYRHTELHVHHTWRPNHSNFNGKNHLALQQGMRNSHIKDRGWADIAQHVSLMPDGMFVTGRDFDKHPISMTGFNGVNEKQLPFMMEMVGDFDKGQDKLEGAQLDSALRLAKFFIDQNKYIRFHREHASKSCPGTGLDKSEFIRMAKEIDDEVKALEGIAKLNERIDDMQKLIEAPTWFVKEFGSNDLGGRITDPHFTKEGWRTIAITLRCVGWKPSK